MKKILGGLYLISAIILFSCDPETQYIKSVQNDTGQEIGIYLTGEGALFNADTIIVDPFSSTEFYNAYSLGRNKSYDCDPRIGALEFTVEVEDGRTLTKDITDPGNWDARTDSKYTFWECTFVIGEGDLE